MRRVDKLLIIVDSGHVRYCDESICIRIRHKEAGGSLLTLSMSNCQLCTLYMYYINTQFKKGDSCSRISIRLGQFATN